MNVNLSITELKSFNYRLIEDDVYVDLNDTSGFSIYRIAVLIKKTNSDFSRSIIEKQFEEDFIYIEQLFVSEENNVLKYILGGDIEDIRSFKSRILSRNIFI